MSNPVSFPKGNNLKSYSMDSNKQDVRKENGQIPRINLTFQESLKRCPTDFMSVDWMHSDWMPRYESPK